MNTRFCFRPGRGMMWALTFTSLGLLTYLHGDDTPPAAPPGASPSPDLSQASAAQIDVQDGSRRVNGNLQALVDDMKQNGMSDTQIATLLQTSDKLDSLNRQDIQKIVDLLKNVSAAPQSGDQQATLLDAYQQQKSVSTQLKELAQELARQASMEAIIHQLEGLITRQSENMRATDQLQKLESQNVVRYDVQKRLANRIISEQTAIATDTTLLAQAMTASPPPPDDSAESPAVAPDIASLQNTAAQAASQTSNGPRDAALSNQAQLKDKLQQTLAIWKARQDTETRLQQAKAQVDAMLKEQTAIAVLTAHTNRGNDNLAERQARVADRAEIAQDVARLNAAAGADLEQAQAQIKQSADALHPASNVAAARPAQAATIAALTDAAKLLAQESAAMEAKKNEPLTDAMKDLQGLKSDIDQAQQKAAQVAQTPPSKPDPALADQVAQLQQKAAPLASKAADSLGDAATKLWPDHPDAPGAAAKLADASKSVQKQMDALDQSAKEYDALAKASDLLNEAVQKTSDASDSLKHSGPPDKGRVGGDLTTAQGDLDQLDSTVGSQSDEAHQIIQKAGGELKAGGMATGQGDLPGAQQHVGAGLKILQDAQAKLAQAKQNAQQKGMAALGKPQTGNQRLAQNHDANHDLQDVQNPDDDVDPKNTGLVKGHHELHGTGPAQVVGILTPTERDALIQSEAEKVPPEYAPEVQQYMKNLSDSSSP